MSANELKDLKETILQRHPCRRSPLWFRSDPHVSEIRVIIEDLEDPWDEDDLERDADLLARANKLLSELEGK